MLVLSAVLLLLGCPEAHIDDPFEFTFTVSVFGHLDGSGRVVIQTPDLAAEDWECHVVALELEGKCTQRYNSSAATDVLATATADADSRFLGWGRDCSGTQSTCTVPTSLVERGFAEIQPFFEAIPDVALTVGGHADAVTLFQGQAGPAEATATRVADGSSITDATFTWVSSDPSVATVGSSSSASTMVTGVAAGTATITASTRGVTSNPVTVTVAGAQVAKGVIKGILYDTDGVTPLDSVYLSMGPVAGSPGSGAQGRTGRQNAGDPVPVPSGGYRFAVDAGQYAIFSVAVLTSRYVTTPGDTAFVFAGDTTLLDLNIKRGYHLDMLGTDLGTIQATAGDSIDIVVDYKAWNRDLCPGCSPAVAIGVDALPLNVHRLGTLGIHPGRTDRSVSIPVTVPSTGGTIYAFLVTTSTAASIQPGLDQYASVWAHNLQGTTMIPIGKLSVN